ND
ncbi:ybaK / prolyl-tRNA synthetases associated domain protein, partial [Vibrio parahaemolyticus V-223/04]